MLYFIHDFINNTCNNQIKLPCNRDVNNNNKYCIMIMLYLILHAMTTCNTQRKSIYSVILVIPYVKEIKGDVERMI